MTSLSRDSQYVDMKEGDDAGMDGMDCYFVIIGHHDGHRVDDEGVFMDNKVEWSDASQPPRSRTYGVYRKESRSAIDAPSEHWMTV